MGTFFQKLLGHYSENSNRDSQRNALRTRHLRIEPLENREMLAITLGEFDVNFSTNMSNDNVVESFSSAADFTTINADITSFADAPTHRLFATINGVETDTINVEAGSSFIFTDLFRNFGPRQ